MFKDLMAVTFDEKKYNCWWLVRKVFKKFGITIPDYDIACQAVMTVDWKPEQIEGIIFKEQEIAFDSWLQIEEEEIKPPCLVLFSNFEGFFSHIGVYLGKAQFIHMHRKKNVCIEEFSHPLYVEKKKRFYRYVE